MKISYIIPTILKFDGLEKQILEIGNTECVSEIIVINNSNGEKLPDIKCKLPIIEIIPEEPSFCNGAWNIGFDNAKSEYIVLSTDDIEYDTNVLNMILSEIKSIEPFGLIGMDYEYISNDLSTVNDITLEEARLDREYGFGIMMIMKKDNYIKIPDDIKHWYGDDFLYYNMNDIGLKNYILKSKTFKLKTKVGSMSGSDETQNRIDEDTRNWDVNYKYKYQKYMKK